MKNKICAKCKISKTIKHFNKYSRSADGKDYYCKDCRSTGNIMSQRRKEATRFCTYNDCQGIHYAKGLCKNCYMRNSRHGSPVLINDGTKTSKHGSREMYIRSQLKSKYKLAYEDYLEMAKNGCHVCAKPNLEHKRLHVDHDHNHCDAERSCGLCVRGVVCDACNVAIGRFDNGILRADYYNYDKVRDYVIRTAVLVSDRIRVHDQEQGNRKR